MSNRTSALIVFLLAVVVLTFDTRLSPGRTALFQLIVVASYLDLKKANK